MLTEERTPEHESTERTEHMKVRRGWWGRGLCTYADTICLRALYSWAHLKLHKQVWSSINDGSIRGQVQRRQQEMSIDTVSYVVRYVRYTRAPAQAQNEAEAFAFPFLY
ncbi:GL15112 [Drosophila persimilis]|uniref:GL15112 n=1 Tax=Drosophila persimilis TaxID=7234 RepID=B4IS75_DROPE|nr:GL15112 [Drosophila persimilis]